MRLRYGKPLTDAKYGGIKREIACMLGTLYMAKLKYILLEGTTLVL